MVRNFRVLGLALVAMLSLSAALASSASASLGTLTAIDGSTPLVTGHAHDSNDSFTAIGNEFKCTGTFEVVKTGSTSNPHEHLQLPATAATVTAKYTECKQGTAAATVTMNGCYYDFTFSNGRIALDCPTGARVEIHRYTAADHANSNCTTTVLPSREVHLVNGSHVYTTVHTTNEYGTVTYINLANGNVTVEGTVNDITIQTHGVCSFGFTLNETATYHVDVEVEAKNTLGQKVPVHVK